MSTTHKATPYARTYNPPRAHELEFLSSDYELGYSFKLEIAESLGERLTEAVAEDSAEDLADIVHETVDSVMPVYYSGILREWQEANCPEAVDIDLGPSIWQLITAGLFERATEFAWALVSGTDTLADTLERLNTIFPYTTD
jgi:hypothetical protein